MVTKLWSCCHICQCLLTLHHWWGYPVTSS